jgi:hypothetical protein
MTHILMIVVRDASSVLVHPHDRRIDHLHRRIMTDDHRIHDPVPHASPPPTAKPDNRHFRDYLLTGRAADMPKSTKMTQSSLSKALARLISCLSVRLSQGLAQPLLLPLAPIQIKRKILFDLLDRSGVKRMGPSRRFSMITSMQERRSPRWSRALTSAFAQMSMGPTG